MIAPLRDLGQDQRGRWCRGSATRRESKRPPHRSTNARTRNRPRPYPAPGALVVKNGSPARCEHVGRHARAAIDDLETHDFLIRGDGELDGRAVGRGLDGVLHQRAKRAGGGLQRHTHGRPESPSWSAPSRSIAILEGRERRGDDGRGWRSDCGCCDTEPSARPLIWSRISRQRSTCARIRRASSRASGGTPAMELSRSSSRAATAIVPSGVASSCAAPAAKVVNDASRSCCAACRRASPAHVRATRAPGGCASRSSRSAAPRRRTPRHIPTWWPSPGCMAACVAWSSNGARSGVTKQQP